MANTGGTRNSATGSGGSACKLGAVQCDCTENHQCDVGLTCASNLCVDMRTLVGSGQGGAGRREGITGGSSNGDLVTGGTSTGSTAGGSGPFNAGGAAGGSRSTGGASSTGGRSVGGATTGTGGTTGGSTATGGAATGGTASGGTGTGGQSCVPTASGGPTHPWSGADQSCPACHAATYVGGVVYASASGGSVVNGATMIITNGNGTTVSSATGSDGFYRLSGTISSPYIACVSQCPNTRCSVTTHTSTDCNASGCHGNSSLRVHLP
jgi:hypothetical protein